MERGLAKQGALEVRGVVDVMFIQASSCGRIIKAVAVPGGHAKAR